MCIWFCFCDVYSTPLNSSSVSVPVPHCFNHCIWHVLMSHRGWSPSFFLNFCWLLSQNKKTTSHFPCYIYFASCHLDWIYERPIGVYKILLIITLNLQVNLELMIPYSTEPLYAMTLSSLHFLGILLCTFIGFVHMGLTHFC